MIPYAHFFNEYFNQNLVVSEQDFIDIYKAKSYEEIAEFCTHRMPFCTYCAVHHRSVRDWCQSKHTIDEWTEPKSLGCEHICCERKHGAFKKLCNSIKKDGIIRTCKKCVKRIVLGK